MVGSAEDVDAFSAICGIQCVKSRDDYRRLEISLPEGSPELERLIRAIEEKYSFKASYDSFIPREKFGTCFSVYRCRSYSKAELEEAELLCVLGVGRVMADFQAGSIENTKKQLYSVENYKKRKTILVGTLKPFSPIAATGIAKEALIKENLSGLTFKPIIGGDDIWTLTSNVRLPRTLTPVEDGFGRGGEDPESESSRYYVDGYQPFELRYGREAVEGVGSFDIAITYERTGPRPETSFPWCVVTQRFREAVERHGKCKFSVTPVRLE